MPRQITADAYRERIALNFMCPGLFQSLWVIGHMVGLEMEDDEPVAAFAKRLAKKLDEVCDQYGVYDDQFPTSQGT